MGFKKMFGMGKKDPFRVPREVAALRAKISLESRENFPSLERYKDIAREAEGVFRQLASIIVLKEHAEEALQIQEEIRKNMEALSAKIKGNMRGESTVHGNDFLEKNIDYLERKSIRNKAKTHFTEFLEAYDAFVGICVDGRPDQAAALNAFASAMISAMKKMNDGFFKVHRDDKEIQDLKESTREKISILTRQMHSLENRLEEQHLRTTAERNLTDLQEAAQEF